MCGNLHVIHAHLLPAYILPVCSPDKQPCLKPDATTTCAVACTANTLHSKSISNHTIPWHKARLKVLQITRLGGRAQAACTCLQCLYSQRNSASKRHVHSHRAWCMHICANAHCLQCWQCPSLPRNVMFSHHSDRLLARPQGLHICRNQP